MMRRSMAVVLFFLSSALASSTWAAYESFFCSEGSTVIADFLPGTLPFTDGTNITNQFKGRGLVFSAEDADLPPEFQMSLGWQENRISGATLYNLFRLQFLDATRPVVSVSVALRDNNLNPQTHTLTAFDRSGSVVDTASFTESIKDGDVSPDRFTLTVSSCKGIAFVVAIEQPFGAEVLERITFTRKQ
jgi:hypothetical protein